MIVRYYVTGKNSMLEEHWLFAVKLGMCNRQFDNINNEIRD